MLRRRSLLPLTLVVAAACESVPPTAPEAPDPSYILIDATTSGNSFFYVVPPVVPSHPAISATLDRTARPRVEICEWSFADDACVVGGTAFTYTMTSGPDDEVITVSDAHFKVNWDTGLEGVEPGMVFRAKVFIVTFELGSVDFEIGETGRDVKNIKTGDNVGLVDGRTLPFNFFIGEGAVEEEEGEAETECEAQPGVIDCDVEVIGPAGGSVTVVEQPGQAEETLAAIVTILADDVFDANGEPVSEFVLTAQHEESPPAPEEDIPSDQQVPFFVQVTAEDGAGPVFFQIGAELILCQHPDLGDAAFPGFIPDALHQFLKIFQVREGVTEILETTLDNQANCPGGLHGGLNTVGIKKFSHFGATLPTVPSASTAVVPDGTVGAPTVIDIQAMLDATSNQIFGGDEVVVTVSGANSASPAVTDNGDGTYTAQYTPLVAGTDMVDIRIRNVATGMLEPISGSPFTSNVSPAVPILLQPTAGTVIPQNDPTIGCTLILENGRGFGFEVFFDWTDVPGAESYEIVAGFPSASIPFVDQTVTQSELRDTNCNTIAGTAEPAEWRVRAISGGVPGPWSAVETFEFADCLLEDGSFCLANTAPIGFEVLPDGSSPVSGMSITSEYSDLGVVFSYVRFDEGAGTPRICDSTSLSPAGVSSDHSVTFDDQTGSGANACTPATLGTITMTFNATTTAVEFRLAHPQGAVPALSAQSKGAAPLTFTVVSSTDYTAQNSLAMTETYYRVSGDVGFISVSQAPGGALMLIDEVHLQQ